MTVYGPGAPKYGRGGRPLPRKPLRAKPRSKGNRAELAVVNMLKDAGWTSARRNWQSGGQGGGDVVEGIPDTYLEIRHRETWNIPAWLREIEAKARPTDTPILAFRKNDTRWWAAVPLDVLLELLMEKCPTCGGTDREGGSVAIAGPDENGQYDTDDCPDSFHGGATK